MRFITDTWIVFSRAMRLSLRNPIWVILGLIQPILYLTLFGPLLEPIAASAPGFPPGDSWQIFVPGLLVQLGLFGASFVGFGLIAEWRAGVVERMRVTPASRTSLLVGRMLRDVVVLVVQGVILVSSAILFGLEAPLDALIMGLAVVALLGAAFSSLSYGAALKMKSEDAFAPLVNGIIVPVLLLSGILLPMTLAPEWLQTVSDLNPLRYVVDGVRAIFLGDIASSATLWGVVMTVLLVIVGVIFGTRTFKRESA